MEWFEKIEPEKRKEIIESFFLVLEENEITTVDMLSQIKGKGLFKLFKAIDRRVFENRKVFINLLTAFFRKEKDESKL